MIITRTPYRVSFFGGGTDFPSYYREHGGSVLSCTINRYSYLHCRILPPFFDHRYRIRYLKTERVSSIEEIQHPSVRECLRYFNYEHPLEILHSGDIPAMSGIGSSSSFTVGLLLALHGLKNKMVTKRELAEQAVIIEQQWIRENVGSQDQYAAAFGGLNRISFGPGDQVSVTPFILPRESLDQLQNNLLFCFSGITRVSSEIQAVHTKNSTSMRPILSELHFLAEEACGALSAGNIDQFGTLLNDAWKLKKQFSSKVTNSSLDALYDTALRAGALGGKICGAGGGGFFLFYVPPGKREAVEAALRNSLIVPMRFETLGAHVIFYSHEDLSSR